MKPFICELSINPHYLCIFVFHELRNFEKAAETDDCYYDCFNWSEEAEAVPITLAAGLKHLRNDRIGDWILSGKIENLPLFHKSIRFDGFKKEPFLLE